MHTPPNHQINTPRSAPGAFCFLHLGAWDALTFSSTFSPPAPPQWVCGPAHPHPFRKQIVFFSPLLLVITQSCPTLCDPMDCSSQAFLSFTISQSLLKLTSVELVMPSNRLNIYCWAETVCKQMASAQRAKPWRHLIHALVWGSVTQGGFSSRTPSP